MANAHVLPSDAGRVKLASSSDPQSHTSAPRANRFIQALVRWFDSMRNSIPEGYEDKSGFHLGAAPSDDWDA